MSRCWKYKVVPSVSVHIGNANCRYFKDIYSAMRFTEKIAHKKICDAYIDYCIHINGTCSFTVMQYNNITEKWDEIGHVKITKSRDVLTEVC